MNKKFLFLLAFGISLIHKPLRSYDLFDTISLAIRMYGVIDDVQGIQNDWNRPELFSRVKFAGKIFSTVSNTESLLLMFAQDGLDKDEKNRNFILPFSAKTKKMYYGTMGLVAVAAALNDTQKIKLEASAFRQCLFFLTLSKNADKACSYLSSLAQQLKKENASCDQAVQTEDGEHPLEKNGTSKSKKVIRK